MTSGLTSRLFSDAHLGAIHQASLRRLQEHGIRLEDAETIEQLKQSGCTTDDAGLVRFRPDLIDRALAEAPRQVSLYSRIGGSRMQLGDGRLHVGAGVNLPFTMDLIGSERRETVLADVTAVGRLCEALDNLDCVTAVVRQYSESVDKWEQRAFLGLLESTTKPVVCSAQSASAMRDILSMAQIAMGGAATLAERPFVLACVAPEASPVLSEEDLAQIRVLVERGIPWMFDVSGAQGDPGTDELDARLLAANVRALGVLTMAQILRPDSPIILGAQKVPDPADGLFCRGLVEVLTRRYELPVWGTAGVSDSKLPDIQAGIECALSLLAASEAGASLVLGAGSLEAGAMGSFEMVVIVDEILGYLRQLQEGDVSQRSSLFDRDAHPVWIESGRANMIRSARDKAIATVGTRLPPAVTEATLTELRAFVGVDDTDSEGEA